MMQTMTPTNIAAAPTASPAARPAQLTVEQQEWLVYGADVGSAEHKLVLLNIWLHVRNAIPAQWSDIAFGNPRMRSTNTVKRYARALQQSRIIRIEPERRYDGRLQMRFSIDFGVLYQRQADAGRTHKALALSAQMTFEDHLRENAAAGVASDAESQLCSTAGGHGRQTAFTVPCSCTAPIGRSDRDATASAASDAEEQPCSRTARIGRSDRHADGADARGRGDPPLSNRGEMPLSNDTVKTEHFDSDPPGSGQKPPLRPFSALRALGLGLGLGPGEGAGTKRPQSLALQEARAKSPPKSPPREGQEGQPAGRIGLSADARRRVAVPLLAHAGLEPEDAELVARWTIDCDETIDAEEVLAAMGVHDPPFWVRTLRPRRIRSVVKAVCDRIAKQADIAKVGGLTYTWLLNQSERADCTSVQAYAELQARKLIREKRRRRG